MLKSTIKSEYLFVKMIFLIFLEEIAIKIATKFCNKTIKFDKIVKQCFKCVEM